MSSSGYQLLMSKLPQRRPALSRMVSSFVTLRFPSLRPSFCSPLARLFLHRILACLSAALWWSLPRVDPVDRALPERTGG